MRSLIRSLHFVILAWFSPLFFFFFLFMLLSFCFSVLSKDFKLEVM